MNGISLFAPVPTTSSITRIPTGLTASEDWATTTAGIVSMMNRIDSLMLIFMVVPQAYTNLSLFKRIEVWILLVLTVAGLVFVLLSNNPPDPYAESESPSPVEGDQTAHSKKPSAATKPSMPTGPLQIGNVTVKREGETYLLEVGVEFDNQSESPVHAIESAKLITGTGKSLPVFFLAFTGTPPVFPAKAKTTEDLRFSLLAEDIVGNLRLDLNGQRRDIKSARSYDPESIAINATQTFKQLDW
ncbi:MAG: hypothetical protein ACI8XO_002469 [Verrucomicrobiales bacterium]